MGEAIIMLNAYWYHIDSPQGTWSPKYVKDNKEYWFSFYTTEDVSSELSQMLKMIASLAALSVGFPAGGMWPRTEADG